jgi:hypothetical protein
MAAEFRQIVLGVFTRYMAGTRCSSWRSGRGNWHLSKGTGMKDDRLHLQLQDSVKNAVFTPGQP